MKRKLPLSGLGAWIGMLLLILDGKTALTGARTGVELCLHTVIPALFPFIILSSVLMGTSFSFLRPLGKLFRIPSGAEQLLIPAFLGGYPVGAQSVADAYRAGQLEEHSARRMLAFCNNAGPSFLFGMIAPLFPKPWMAWALWGIHLGSAVMVARLIPSKIGTAAPVAPRTVRITDALSSSVRVMAFICGWVVLFRVAIAFLKRWVFFLLPVEIQVMLTGMLELTNGCCELPLVENTELRFVLCSGILALGGLCVTMQTVSVTKGLSLRYYGIGKALQTLFSLLLCGCLFRGTAFVIATLLIYFALKLANKQKRAGIPAPAGI